MDKILESCVVDIFTEYDVDKSGQLDKEEFKAIIMSTIQGMIDIGQGPPPGLFGENGKFSDQDFDKCFSKVDTDNSGLISKDEMLVFIKEVAGN